MITHTRCLVALAGLALCVPAAVQAGPLTLPSTSLNLESTPEDATDPAAISPLIIAPRLGLDQPPAGSDPAAAPQQPPADPAQPAGQAEHPFDPFGSGRQRSWELPAVIVEG